MADSGRSSLRLLGDLERVVDLYRLVALHGRYREPPAMDVFHRRHWLVADNAGLRAESEKMASLHPAVAPIAYPDREVHVWCHGRDLRAASADVAPVGVIDIAADEPILADVDQPGQVCSNLHGLAHWIGAQGKKNGRFVGLSGEPE